jgi:hypothetical protein
MKKALLVLLFLGLMGFLCLGNDGVPVAISPGMAGGVGVVESRCPTFSWSGVAWAQMYRVVVFGVEDAVAQTDGEIKLTSKPLLSEDIAGGLSWTPSVSQGLTEGFDYAWYVGAMDAGGAWAWSESRRFRVEANAKPTLIAGDSSAQKQPVRKAEASDKAALPATAGSAAGTAAGKKGKANDPAYGSEGTYSTFYGTGAGANNSFDSTYCSFFGSGAGYSNTTGVQNVFVGYNAGNANNTGNFNTFIGTRAGLANTTGRYNTFIALDAGHDNSTGESNNFIGVGSGIYNTTGGNNTFLGCSSGYQNTTGYNNTFIGNFAGNKNQTGYNNTCIGYKAGESNTTGNVNVFLGYQAGYFETGSNKLYIDNNDTAAPLIYGDFSTDKVGINGWLGVGTQVPAYPMELKTTGRAATFVLTKTDGGASNFINATATYGQFGTVNNFAVRILVNSSPRLTLNSDNSLAMASGATCTAGGVWTNASSLALKENIAQLSSAKAAAALEGLHPVTYNYKADKVEEYVGFIAEEVPELVAMNDRKSLSPMDIVAVLTKVVQEQQKLNQEQQKAISALQNKLSVLEKKVAEKQ